jgi:pyruvate dehydrogenase E2 component (dihydrolipoamide acetyltransferase)
VARLLRMPEVAANASEAVLADWAVEENADFAARDTLVSIETEKAVVDVEAEAAGVVLKTLVPPGAQVEVGAPIAVVGDPGERVDDLASLLVELGVAESSAPVVPERRDVPGEAPREPVPDPEGGTASTGPSAPSGVPAATTPSPATDGRVFASPLARKLAKAAGIAVGEIQGTGPRNRILRRDVERAVTEQGSSAKPIPAAPGQEAPAVPIPAPGTAGPARHQDVPHSRIRRATAARLTQSKQTAPHFYLRATVSADALVALRRELNEGSDVAISLNDLVVKAAAAAHLKVPEMNVVWTEDAVRRFEGVDVAVAVATERGLLTPVVRDVGRLSVTALAAQVRALVERTRAGRLRQEDLEGGSLSVTNLGMFGTEEFAAIINPPHAAILAVGAVRQEPVVVDGELAVGHVMRLTLSVDHRPVDGVAAARWMQALVELLEHPVRILA